ncbi:MAG: glutamate 5-kinase [Lentisphaerae bacterium GWF2_52_8]|nr:MAG: glutamate 5-kinase [Lentisphaerae bacterium GWF2_52_8]
MTASYNREARRRVLKACTQIVVKVGTRLLTDPARIPALVAQIARIRERGHKVLLVSSGAVGTGMKAMKLSRRPSKLSEVQALASIGQNRLMALYDKECAKLGFHSAQMLLTAADLRDRERHLNVSNCISSLWAMDVLPIANENDSVSVDELKFGDNDTLAGLLAVMTRSSLTVILTSVDGLRERAPDGSLGERISVVSNISDEMRKSASGTDDSAMSVGGMSSKLAAAQIITSAGESLWIAEGQAPDTLDRIMQGEDIGTVFLPAERQMESKKRWLSFFSQSAGRIMVDKGAMHALGRKGRSLLPSGITGIEGSFKRGDTVEITGPEGELIAKGLVNFSASDCRKIAGRQSSELSSILGCPSDDEVVHRNNLALLRRGA